MLKVMPILLDVSSDFYFKISEFYFKILMHSSFIYGLLLAIIPRPR